MLPKDLLQDLEQDKWRWRKWIAGDKPPRQAPAIPDSDFNHAFNAGWSQQQMLMQQLTQSLGQQFRRTLDQQVAMSIMGVKA